MVINMAVNRLLCVLLIIGTGIYASFYGGNISYALFYLSVLIPIISFLYTLYVYSRFKLYQTIGSRIVVKGDWTDYAFTITNEDFITYRNIKVKFLREKSIIEDTEQTAEYSLLPGEQDRLVSRIKCNYRGEYFIGVDSVEVTDFLYLFSITYPLGSKLKVSVLPRVLQLEQLGIAEPQVDVKNPLSNNNREEEELDTEIRKYSSGDNRKRIHWKASARHQELLTRKYQHRQRVEIILFMDLMDIKEDELKVTIVEDKIIESILAISNFYAVRGTSTQIVYEMVDKRQVTIRSKGEFNIFYKACINIRFEAKIPIYDLIKDRMLRGGEGSFYVVATHFLTKELYLTSLQVLARGIKLSVLFISDDLSEGTKKLKDGLRQAGVNIYQVMSDDEIDKVLSKEIG
ncbi:MAG TPA: DUF58 domain-containing protein [Clostridiales bacterium]|nr:DUF58 domain-containing protein [Clostridiales bacterium]